MQKVLRPVWQLNEFDKALITGTYFGFTPIVTPRITPADLEMISHCEPHPHYDAAEKVALIRTYIEHNFANLPHPLALSYKKKRPAGYSLHLIGSPTGMTEALLIRAALSILAEEGFKNLQVALNYIGDKESIGVYERELGVYIKKYGTSISDELRLALKDDVFNLWRLEHEEAIQFRSSAPSAISYLSSQSRNHFKEVLEYVEALGVDFTLAPELIGEKNHSSHTVFAIRPSGLDRELSPEVPATLAVGYRYSRLGKRAGLRKEIPMASVTIFTPAKQASKKVYKELPKPKFFLVQLGPLAKIKTLGLIEMLRANRIPVHHFFGKDKLTAQLSGAESLLVNYLIIIGQKEALDDTATIRNMQTRAQETIPMHLLPNFLKNISL